MEFLLLIETRSPGSEIGADEMGKLARELEAQGVLRAVAGPLERGGARIRKRGASPEVTDGPFADGLPSVRGCFIVDVGPRRRARARQALPVGGDGRDRGARDLA